MLDVVDHTIREDDQIIWEDRTSFLHLYFVRLRSRARWKKNGVIFNANGIRTHLKVHTWHTNDVLGLSLLLVFICQYLEYPSNVVQYCALPIVLMHASICGKGYVSFTVMVLKFLQSKQKRNLQSFFGTNSNGAAHSEIDGSIDPDFNWLSISVCSSSSSFGPAQYGGYLKGLESGISFRFFSVMLASTSCPDHLRSCFRDVLHI